MHQSSLFNYQPLTSTKAMKALHRARRAQAAKGLASPSSKSPAVSANKFPATPAPVPASSPMPPSTCSPEKQSAVNCQPFPRKQTVSEPDNFEFNLPDEDRILKQVFIKGARCPACLEFPHLQRKCQKGRRNLYRVGCPDKLFDILPQYQKCPDPTPWQESSAKAVKLWRMMRLLTQ